MSVHVQKPGWFTRNVLNRAVSFITRHGVSVLGSRVLAVQGRTSGTWRTTPVNLLRAVFNAAFDAGLPMLPERNWVFVDQEHIYDLVDITDRVRR